MRRPATLYAALSGMGRPGPKAPGPIFGIVPCNATRPRQPPHRAPSASQTAPRAQKHKRLAAMQKTRTTPWLDRFWLSVQPEPNTGCWLWDGPITGNGYGTMKRHARMVGAHRLSYEIHKGAIPSGLTIDHLCSVRSCVNPDHLEAVTIGENIRRAGSANGRKTHCKHGHEFTPENTRLRPKGRECRACDAIRARSYRAKNGSKTNPTRPADPPSSAT